MTALTAESVGDLRALTPDFERSLRAAHKSPKAVTIYGDAARRLCDFLVRSGMPTEAAKIRREHAEAFIEEQLASHKPATANQRCRSLAQLFKFLSTRARSRPPPWPT